MKVDSALRMKYAAWVSGAVFAVILFLVILLA